MSKHALALPHRGRGRLSEAEQRRYDDKLHRWCEGIIEIGSQLDFKVSSRGWCYILEECGLDKGDFDRGERLINDCRKDGLLPLDICGDDDGRETLHLENIDDETPTDFAQDWIDYLSVAHEQYCPISFWDDLDVYLEMTVEKIDLRNLFAPVCKPFCLPLTNISDWNDINARAAMMRRFKYWEGRGKRCILLHCGDHDPGGLNISDFLRSNLSDLAKAVGWSPDNLIVDRFGLSYDFIQRHRLTWIDNLITGNRVDPRLAFLLSCAIRFEMVERDEMTLDEALDADFVERFRQIGGLTCYCELETIRAFEAEYQRVCKERLRQWRWSRQS